MFWNFSLWLVDSGPLLPGSSHGLPAPPACLCPGPSYKDSHIGVGAAHITHFPLVTSLRTVSTCRHILGRWGLGRQHVMNLRGDTMQPLTVPHSYPLTLTSWAPRCPVSSCQHLLFSAPRAFSAAGFAPCTQAGTHAPGPPPAVARVGLEVPRHLAPGAAARSFRWAPPSLPHFAALLLGRVSLPKRMPADLRSNPCPGVCCRETRSWKQMTRPSLQPGDNEDCWRPSGERGRPV